MRNYLLPVLVAAATLLALPTPAARAGTVTATIRDSSVSARNGGLRGDWTANFHGGRVRSRFGGTGSSQSLTPNLWKFHSSGADRIVAQSDFNADIFAEATSYGPFHYDELFIQGVSGASLAAVRGSTPQIADRSSGYGGDRLVNFWMNRVTFNSPGDGTSVYSTGDRITGAIDHRADGGVPYSLPQPTTWAMLGLSVVALGVWTRQRLRRLARSAAAGAS